MPGKLSRDMTPEEAYRALGIALGFAEQVSSKVEMGRGYKQPAKRLIAYMPIALQALDTIKDYIDESEQE